MGFTMVSAIFYPKGSNFFQFFSEALAQPFELGDFRFDAEQGLLHFDGVTSEPVFDVLEAEPDADGTLREADAFGVGDGIQAIAVQASLRVEQAGFLIKAQSFGIDTAGYG